jgi:hypothetical protein
VVPQVGREPDVRTHVAAVGRGVAQQEPQVQLVQDQQAARDDDQDPEHPPAQLEVAVLGWELGVGRRRNLGKRPGFGRERLRRELTHRHPLSMAATRHLFGSLRSPQI